LYGKILYTFLSLRSYKKYHNALCYLKYEKTVILLTLEAGNGSHKYKEKKHSSECV
jgi:hypothetical protein